MNRISSSALFKRNWNALSNVSARMKRTLFRGLFIRVDISKIDFTTPRRSHFISNQRDLSWARSEIRKYLAQGVLSPSTFSNPLIHPWFVVRRKGRRRLVVDFDRLNAAILSPTTVSYEDLSSVPSLVRHGKRWLTSLDLKSAFHHVPLAPSIQRLSCIAFQGSILTFRVMSFGLSVAPRVWCAIMAAALAPLRSHINLSFYMDDILIASPSPSLARSHTLLLIRHLQALGLVISFDKSSLTPATSIRHLGFIIDARSSCFRIPSDKAKDIAAFCKTAAIRPQLRVLTAMSLLGKILALRYAFSPARRYTWSLIQELTSAIPPNRRARSQLRGLRIHLSPVARSDLLWIASNIHSFPPSPFFPKASLHLYTDACLTGWGAWSPQLSVAAHGRWTLSGNPPHIQILELDAVLHALSALPIPPFSRIVLHTDNIAVLFYVRRWGGSRSPLLNDRTRLLWDTLLSKNCAIIAAHYIPSTLNRIADSLSRI